MPIRWFWCDGMSPSRNWPLAIQMEEYLFGFSMRVVGLWSWWMTVEHRYLYYLGHNCYIRDRLQKCVYKKQTWKTSDSSTRDFGSFSGEWLHLVPRWHSGSHLVPWWVCFGGICQRAETLVLWDQPGKPDHLWYLDSRWPAGNLLSESIFPWVLWIYKIMFILTYPVWTVI